MKERAHRLVKARERARRTEREIRSSREQKRRERFELVPLWEERARSRSWSPNNAAVGAETWRRRRRRGGRHRGEDLETIERVWDLGREAMKVERRSGNGKGLGLDLSF